MPAADGLLHTEKRLDTNRHSKLSCKFHQAFMASTNIVEGISYLLFRGNSPFLEKVTVLNSCIRQFRPSSRTALSFCPLVCRTSTGRSIHFREFCTRSSIPPTGRQTSSEFVGCPHDAPVQARSNLFLNFAYKQYKEKV